MPTNEVRRPDPEQLLRQVQEEERQARRGRLKVFLGYASGVGKSFRMLDEGRRRRERGQDVAVGAIQDRNTPEVERLLAGLELIPALYQDGVVTVDVAAVLERRPSVVLIDGLAYNNPPGSRNAKRWQDVEELLECGISVITSVNLQHIEEQADAVEKITGKRAAHTIPQRFLSSADEIVLVDAPADQLLRRSGDASTVQDERGLQLSQLRELALLLAADVVDAQLEEYLQSHGIEQLWGTQERILVCIAPRTNAAAMIASGARNAKRFHGDLFVAYVNQPGLSDEDRAALEAGLTLARETGAKVEALNGSDPVDAIMHFARAHGVTQIFVGHTSRQDWWGRLRGNIVDRLIRESEGIDVRLFPH